MYRQMPTAQSRVVSAALLAHCRAHRSSHSPVGSERGPSALLSPGLVRSRARGQPAGAAGSPRALPCSLLGTGRAPSEPTKPTDWWLRLWSVCLLGFLTIHVCRGQLLTAGQSLHLTDALSNHQPFQQPVRAPLLGCCSLFLCLAVQPWNGTWLHRDLLPANNIFLFSNKKFKKFTSFV